MSFEQVLFCSDYTYDVDLVNRYIHIIKSSKDEKQISLTKDIVFKYMKNVVTKNIANYINLLKGIQYFDIPDKDDLISECYIIFDKCISRFNLKYSTKSNFYFFLNKSFSRYFYKEYRNIFNKNNKELNKNVDDSDNIKYFQEDDFLTMLKFLNFSEDEIKIINNKSLGNNKKIFLQNNDDFSNEKYSNVLKSIKYKINILKNKKII
jgi:hypothetical protein